MSDKGCIMKQHITLLASMIAASAILMNGCAVSGVKGQVIGENSKGIEGVYIIYGYGGLEYKIADSDSYYRPGTIVKTDDKGFFELPGMVHFYAPFLKSNLSLEIFVIYDPHTHSAGILPNNDRYYHYYSCDGLSEFTKSYSWLTYKQEGDLEVLMFRDITENPMAWYRSIKILSGTIMRYGNNSWDATNEDKQAFLNHLLRECDEFQSQYGQERCLEGYYKGKTWDEVLYQERRSLDWYTERLFDKPDYWHTQ